MELSLKKRARREPGPFVSSTFAFRGYRAHKARINQTLAS
jgi:hypothetical protein